MTASSGRIVTGGRVEIAEVHGDLSQQVVQITVDRLCLVLDRHLNRIQRSRDWIAPAGVLLSILLTFASSTFRDYLLSASTWCALFVLLGIADLGWLLVTLARLRGAETVDQLVERIKSHERP